MRITKFLLAATALMLFASPGQAADMDEPILVEAQDEYQPVEVGSGWYLRGDIGYTINKPYDKFEDQTGFKLSDSPINGSIGAGYHINDFLRVEFNAGILPTQEFKHEYASTCEGTQTTTTTWTDINGNVSNAVDVQRTSRSCIGADGATNKAYDGLAHIYADLGTYSGFTPYIGAGLGVIYSKYREYVNDRECVEPAITSTGGNPDTTIVWECDPARNYKGLANSESQYGLAYALSAGVAWQVSDNVAMDFGYTYKGAPGMRFVTSGGGGTIKYGEGTDFHTVKVGLRYDLW